MAVTSVWPVTLYKPTVEATITEILRYAANDKKTKLDNTSRKKMKDSLADYFNSEKFKKKYNCDELSRFADIIDIAMATAPDDFSKERQAAIDSILNYTTQKEKTEDLFVTGINCFAETARQDFMSTKEMWNKPGGRIAYHGYQSFLPGEVTPENAHRIGIELAKRMWEGFEVVVTTHLDRSHLHNHFVINSVCALDGHKYHNSRSDYHRMREISDELCRKYGLSVVKKKLSTKRRTDVIKADIDAAIASSSVVDFASFLEEIKRLGYRINRCTDKTFSVIPPGGTSPIRPGSDKNLGSEYSMAGIAARIKSRDGESVKKGCSPHLPLKADAGKRIAPAGRKIYAPPAKYRSISIMFGVYSALLFKGSLSVNPTQYELAYSMRRCMAWVDAVNEEKALLAAKKIRTAEDIKEAYNEAKKTVAAYEEKKRHLRNRLRRCGNLTEKEEIKKRLKEIYGEEGIVKREIRLYDRIRERVPAVHRQLCEEIKRTADYNAEKTRKYSRLR